MEQWPVIIKIINNKKNIVNDFRQIYKNCQKKIIKNKFMNLAGVKNAVEKSVEK